MAMAVPVNEVGARPFLSPRNPIWSLTLAFALWKTLVFLVVAACPGPGYDTSTSLLPYQVPAPATDSASASSLTHHLRTLPLKFVRWDAIYFVHIIEHGYVFEQEWAFGWGYTRLLNVLTSGMALLFSRILLLSRILTLAISLQFVGADRWCGSHSLGGYGTLALEPLSVRFGPL